MYDYGFDFEKEDKIAELRRRVERKKEKEAAKKLTRKANFDLYLEESGPLDLAQELGYEINNRDWDE